MSKMTKYMSKKTGMSFSQNKTNPKSKIIQKLDADKMLTLLYFGPEIQNLLISIPTISIYQNPPISFFQKIGGGGIN